MDSEKDVLRLDDAPRDCAPPGMAVVGWDEKPTVAASADGQESDVRAVDEALEEATADRQVIELRRQVRFKGNMVGAITLDFGGLSMRDFESIDAEMTTTGIPGARNVMLSTAYVLRIAARAAGTNIDEFTHAGFHAKDVNRIIQVTQNFLIA